MRSPEQDSWGTEAQLLRLSAWRWIPAALLGLPLAAVRYLRHGCIQWAAALAYYTLIGLVPLLAVLFVILKAFHVHVEITPYIVSTIGAGSTDVANQVIQFINETNVRAVGILSSIGALLAVLGILGNAELCLNFIWGGAPGRPLGRKLLAFAKVIVGAPLLLLLALTLTALTRQGSHTREFFDEWYMGELLLLALAILPYALLWAAFTVLYTRLPNTNVRFRSALLAAVVAGTLWQLAQWTYVSFVIRIVLYSKVYGALWQLPILLAWVYIAWSIILFGAEMSRAHQEITLERLTADRPAAPPVAASDNPPMPRHHHPEGTQ